jgi:ABC-2 type transport system ATP-binding protein
MDMMIEAQGLTKYYGDVHALDGLDLAMPTGQVFAILGPNGAGKTTFIRTIATLTRPTSGTLNVAGIDVTKNPKQVRRAIGLAGQYAAVEGAMTGRENLRMIARLFGHDAPTAKFAADAVLDQMGLIEAGDRLVRTYSGGMQRRLDLGASLVGAPRLLLLDEPTTGLDPRSRNELWVSIEELAAQGTDVLLTTQYLDEADRLAHTIAIIDRGKLVASGTSNQLKARLGRDVVDVHVIDEVQVERAAVALGPEATIDTEERRVSLPVTSGADELVGAVRALADASVSIDDIALRRPTLDDVFMALTGRSTERADSGEADVRSEEKSNV